MFGLARANKVITIDRNSYAAIAYSRSTGQYGYGYNYRSRRAAEKAALAKCNAPDAFIANWVNWGFAALALGNDKSVCGIGYVYGPSCKVSDAIDAAKKNCSEGTTGVYVVVVLSSDGQYILEQRDKNSFVDQDGKVYKGSIASPGVTTTVVTKDGKVFKYDADGNLIEGDSEPNSSAAPSAAPTSNGLGKASAEAGKDH